MKLQINLVIPNILDKQKYGSALISIDIKGLVIYNYF